ncbi:MAG: FoF1 ATP synthase subunit gamma [Candidatus Saccharimonadales bacterium]
MKRPQEIAVEEASMATVVSLTSAFEGIASMRISQIKNQVLQAQTFFEALWQIYRQLRLDPIFRFGRTEHESEMNQKELYIGITAEGGFSGDIDQRLIKWMIDNHDPAKQDIIIVGHHGAVQLSQLGVAFKKYYKLPEKEETMNVSPLIREVRGYKKTTVFYQTYVSLMVQDIKRIELGKAVQDAASHTKANEDVISEANYIFEPSALELIAHLERSMLDIALSQLILDSKLAQYASRFRSMSGAKDRATESHKELRLLYNRTKRSIADERLKEILNGRKKAVSS